LLGAALLGAGALTAAAGSAAADPPTVVTYSMQTNWGSGFQALVTITPGAAVTGWTLEFDAAEGQQLMNAFYAGATQTGRHVTLTQAPTPTVPVPVGQGSASAVLAAPQRLSFTPADWNVPQTLTLTSPADADTTNQTAWIALNAWGGTPFYASEFLFATQLDN